MAKKALTAEMILDGYRDVLHDRHTLPPTNRSGEWGRFVESVACLGKRHAVPPTFALAFGI
jgi:hypothetical protein